MNQDGVRSWPPAWVRRSRPPGQVISGEIGVLTDVQWHAIKPERCYLTMEFQKERYMGALLLKDAAFARLIYDILRQHTGKPIEQIGDLDLNQTR